MTDFSIGEALGAGFGLVRQRPVSIFAWGLAYVLLGVAAPMASVLWALGPDFIALMSKAQAGLTPAADPRALAGLQAKLLVVQPMMILAPLVVQSLVGGAAFRAVLEPSNQAFASIRLGRQELWLGLLTLVAGFLAMMALFVVQLGGLIVGLLLHFAFEAAHAAMPLRIAAFVALGLVLLVGVLAVAVRFSLAGPMTFSEAQFRLFESWQLTRGHGWKLLGLGLLVTLAGMVVMMLFEALMAGGVLLAALGSHLGAADVKLLPQHPEILLRPGLVAAAVFAALLLTFSMGAVFAISLAPWAVAYRRLLPTARPSPREGGLYVPAPAAPPAAGFQADEHAHADPHAGGDGSAHGDGPSESA